MLLRESQTTEAVDRGSCSFTSLNDEIYFYSEKIYNFPKLNYLIVLAAFATKYIYIIFSYT